MNLSLQKFKELKVAICVPSNGVWYEEFGKSLANLVNAFHSYRIGNYKTQQLNTISVKGSILPKSRLSGLKQAKEMEADYLLYVDADQSFPKHTLHLLIKRNVDVIGANIATKTIPTLPTARRKTEGPGELVFTDTDSKGIEKVWRVGTGLLLLSKKVIRALPYNSFEMKYREDVENYQGEDWSLCEAIEKLGFDIYIDHDLSNQVGHHGSFNFTHEFNGTIQQSEAA